MKYLNNKIITVGIFFAATALLILYLLSIRWHIYLPVTLFWVAVSSMLGIIIYQSLKIELSSSYTKVVLLEIVVTGVVLHLIYQIPYYGLRGWDIYRDMASVKAILSSGLVRGAPQYVTEYSYFPAIHIFGAVLSLITHIDLFSVVKWFPSLLDLALVPLLYLLVRSIFNEEKIALLSALLFACLQQYILTSSLFIRQTYALVLAICCIYLYLSAKNSPHSTTNLVLSIICFIGTVFAHHLTSFMLLVFLLIHLLVTKASKVTFLQRTYFRDNITGAKVSITFSLIAFTALFAYWMYVVSFPLQTLSRLLLEVFTPGKWGTNTYAEVADISAATIQTVRGYIMFYGFYFFTAIFGIILLYRLFPRAKNRRIEVYSFTLFLFLCGVVGFLSLYIIAAAAYPHRFLLFGWLFGFTPLVVAILKSKIKWRRRVGIFLLITFMLLNIYMIDPKAYDPRTEGSALVTSEENYALANTFDFSGGQIFGFQNSIMAIYSVHNNLGTTITLSEVNLTKFDWIIIEKEDLELLKKQYQEPRPETIAALQNLSIEFPLDYNKIYESDSLQVFKMRQKQRVSQD